MVSWPVDSGQIGEQDSVGEYSEAVYVRRWRRLGERVGVFGWPVDFRSAVAWTSGLVGAAGGSQVGDHAAAIVQEHVLLVEVTVHDAPSVQRVQAVGDIGKDRQYLSEPRRCGVSCGEGT